MANKHFTVNRRRLITLAAFAVPVGLGLGILVSELTWVDPTLALPELCMTSTPNGETSVSTGACPDEGMPEI